LGYFGVIYITFWSPFFKEKNPAEAGLNQVFLFVAESLIPAIFEVVALGLLTRGWKLRQSEVSAGDNQADNHHQEGDNAKKCNLESH
jgi:hypothetical protein